MQFLTFKAKLVDIEFVPLIGQMAIGYKTGSTNIWRIQWIDPEIEMYAAFLEVMWVDDGFSPAPGRWSNDWFGVANPRDIVRYRLNSK
jgi:hypothetical protein